MRFNILSVSVSPNLLETLLTLSDAKRVDALFTDIVSFFKRSHDFTNIVHVATDIPRSDSRISLLKGVELANVLTRLILFIASLVDYSI